jgi:hypothetical protein
MFLFSFITFMTIGIIYFGFLYVMLVRLICATTLRTILLILFYSHTLHNHYHVQSLNYPSSLIWDGTFLPSLLSSPSTLPSMGFLTYTYSILLFDSMILSGFSPYTYDFSLLIDFTNDYFFLVIVELSSSNF